MANERSSTPQQGMHGESNRENGERARTQQPADGGEERRRARGLDADPRDDVIDRFTRGAPPVTDPDPGPGSRRG